jgi:hypothetical protein
MTDKSVLIRSFNTHFLELINDILLIFPTNQDIKHSLNSFQMISRLNPTIVIRTWYSNIYIPYNLVIYSGDITFFLEKNYAEDLSNASNAKEIMGIIDRIREPIKSMNAKNREHTIKYLQNLTKLSKLYSDI